MILIRLHKNIIYNTDTKNAAYVHLLLLLSTFVIVFLIYDIERPFSSEYLFAYIFF